MAVLQSKLLSYLDGVLQPKLFKDYAPNGLQIEGTSSVQRLCTAVTASLEVIETAIEDQADALLVHHGYFWRGETPNLTGMRRARIAALLAHNINLIAYHLPLDAHSLYGNNIGLGKALGLSNIQSTQALGQPDLLWSGAFDDAISVARCRELVGNILGRDPLVISGGEHQIKRIAWCSGGGQDLIEAASDLNVDAYISGEVSERTYYMAKEMGIHYFSAGHHATERFGVQLLGEHLKTQFDLDLRFIDSANPV